eukprot:2464417-Rhodomonas_salina.1
MVDHAGSFAGQSVHRKLCEWMCAGKFSSTRAQIAAWYVVGAETQPGGELYANPLRLALDSRSVIGCAHPHAQKSGVCKGMEGDGNLGAYTILPPR